MFEKCSKKKRDEREKWERTAADVVIVVGS